MKKLRVVELEGGRIGVLLAIPEGNEPPTEIRVFKNGLTETTKGPVLFDDKAAEAVMAEFQDRGRDALPFDIAHGMLNPFAPPDAHKAAGWFKPEVREDGLYAANIEWTEFGATALRKREFRYFSPAILRDHDSGRVRELINIALTNIPATKHQKPLVAHDADPTARSSPMLEQILKALGVHSEAEALSAAVELNNLLAGVLALTGAQNAVAALAIATGWKQSSEALAKRVGELELEGKKIKLDAAIEKLSREGKLPPSLHDWARSTQTAESLERSPQRCPPCRRRPPPPRPAATRAARRRLLRAKL